MLTNTIDWYQNHFCMTIIIMTVKAKKNTVFFFSDKGDQARTHWWYAGFLLEETEPSDLIYYADPSKKYQLKITRFSLDCAFSVVIHSFEYNENYVYSSYFNSDLHCPDYNKYRGSSSPSRISYQILDDGTTQLISEFHCHGTLCRIEYSKECRAIKRNFDSTKSFVLHMDNSSSKGSLLSAVVHFKTNDFTCFSATKKRPGYNHLWCEVQKKNLEKQGPEPKCFENWVMGRLISKTYLQTDFRNICQKVPDYSNGYMDDTAEKFLLQFKDIHLFNSVSTTEYSSLKHDLYSAISRDSKMVFLFDQCLSCVEYNYDHENVNLHNTSQTIGHKTEPAVTIYYPDSDLIQLKIYANNNQIHRSGNLPAVIYTSRDQDVIAMMYFKHGKLHNIKGPAILRTNSDSQVLEEQWFINGNRPRPGIEGSVIYEPETGSSARLFYFNNRCYLQKYERNKEPKFSRFLYDLVNNYRVSYRVSYIGGIDNKEPVYIQSDLFGKFIKDEKKPPLYIYKSIKDQDFIHVFNNY